MLRLSCLYKISSLQKQKLKTWIRIPEGKFEEVKALRDTRFVPSDLHLVDD